MLYFKPISKIICGAILVSSLCISCVKKEKDEPVKLPMVIVHGAWGGSWAFAGTDAMISAEGYTVIRPSLTGLGERVHLASSDIDLDTHILDVVNAILYEDLHDVVLVGHSYGGMVVTGVADSIPERIAHLVYLDAFLPLNGESAASLTGGPDSWITRSADNDFVIPTWVREDQPIPKDVPHPVKTLTQPVSIRAHVKEIPATYILTTEDEEQWNKDSFALFYNRAKTLNYNQLLLVADHTPYNSAPIALKDMLLDILRDAGSSASK